jgi:hypothetical protein
MKGGISSNNAFQLLEDMKDKTNSYDKYDKKWKVNRVTKKM